MAVKQKVLLVGGTGETGKEILKGLLDDGNIEVSCLVQPSSLTKPATRALANQDIELVIADLTAPAQDIANSIKGYDSIISAIGFRSRPAELALVDAVALAGTSRFVPCAFASVAPPGGILKLRDEKEGLYQRIWQHRIPFTIIDVGFWYQLSIPRVPSGKLDYALVLPLNEVFGDGDAPNLLIDKRDIGVFVAKIVGDERTVNQKVVCYGQELSQNEIVKIVGEKSGEKLEITHTSVDATISKRDQARKSAAEDPEHHMKRSTQTLMEYCVSKYVRKDNTLENAKYLGYLDARELYPDVKPITFAKEVEELLDGLGERPYQSTFDFEKFHKVKNELK